MVRFLTIFIVVFGLLSVTALPAQGKGQKTLNVDDLIMALIQIESGGNDRAIGDKHLAEKAYGCLQIRQPAVDDVNRKHGTHYRAEDCLGNRELSIWVFKEYINIHATDEKLGRNATFEDASRIWNGGPVGCFNDGAINKDGLKPKNKKKQEKIARLQKNAKKYWQKVLRILEKFS